MAKPSRRTAGGTGARRRGKAVATCRIEYHLPQRSFGPPGDGSPPAWRETIEQLLLAAGPKVAASGAAGVLTLDAISDYGTAAVPFSELSYLFRDLLSKLPALVAAADPSAAVTITRNPPGLPRLQITAKFSPGASKPPIKAAETKEALAPLPPSAYDTASMGTRENRGDGPTRLIGSHTDAAENAASEARLAAEYDAVYRAMAEERQGFMSRVREDLEPRLNAVIRERLRNNPPVTSEEKSELAAWVNGQLAALGLALYDPKTRRQAVLRTTGRGDVQIVPHGAKNPSISRADISEILPLLITAAGVGKKDGAESRRGSGTGQGGVGR